MRYTENSGKMKNHEFKQAVFISILILLSVGIGICLFNKWYWLVFFLLFFLSSAVTRLIRYQNNTIKGLRRFVDSIRFEEFNISFRNSVNKGLDAEIGKSLDAAITVLNEKAQQKNARLNFNELLLNRIDFSIIVADKSDRVIWINKAAVNLVGRIKDLRELTTFSAELYETISNISSRETKIVKFSDDRKNEGVAVSVVFAIIRKDDIRIISLKNIQSVINETESEAWKKLVSIMRHEIMNSMAPIISLSETFSDLEIEYEPETINKTMRTIYRRSKGLVEFVQNYRSITNIPKPYIANFKITEMLDDIVSLMNAQDIKFDYTVIPDNLIIKADRIQIEQVLINLIKNASEALVSTKPPVITVSAGLDNNQRPLISVSDNGVGILPEVQERIFIPFFTTKKNGSGIGLSICKQIIHAHGGNLLVTSTLDEGSCFTIKL